MKEAIYKISIAVLVLIGVFFLYSSIHTLLNHYYYFSPNKIAVEFESSMIFAGGYFVFSAMNLSIAFIIYGRYKKQKNV